MISLINLVALLVLCWYPIKLYAYQSDSKIKKHPFDSGVSIVINKELDFLVYSIVTAMFFLGPFSLWKYAFWVLALMMLLVSRLKVKTGPIITTYLLFVGWGVISTVLITDQTFQAVMMLVKYILPLLYLWLAYTAINDEDDLLFFMKIVAIGMCVYALLIGGFSHKALPWLYRTLALNSGGLVITYAYNHPR